MPAYQSHYGSSFAHNSADADLLLRLGFALAAWQRNAWRAVRLKSQNGIVRLEGVLPTFHDRQLILAVAQHVAGVLRVEDELTVAEFTEADLSVAEPDVRPEPAFASVAKAHSNHGGTEEKQPTPPNAFYHLPVLDESLEDILAKRAQANTAAG